MPSSGWIASCPPSAPPIAHGLPTSPGLGALRVVPALAVRAPDRVDRREVEDVEAELGEPRHDLGDAREAAPRARKELVPGARARPFPLDLDLERGAAAGPVPVAGRELRRRRAPFVERSLAEERRALGELAREVCLSGGDLPVVLVEPARVAVDPRDDLEPVPADLLDAVNDPAKRSEPSATSGDSRQRPRPRRCRTTARTTS